MLEAANAGSRRDVRADRKRRIRSTLRRVRNADMTPSNDARVGQTVGRIPLVAPDTHERAISRSEIADGTPMSDSGACKYLLATLRGSAPSRPRGEAEVQAALLLQ